MYNGHGDVTALLDAAGTIQATYYYDAFGNILESTGNVNNPFTYAGYQYDKETGLYYCNSRMYDPVTARFLQEDTYGGDPNDPLSLNRYIYTYNNPLKYYDPTGHWPNFGGFFSGIGSFFSGIGSSISSWGSAISNTISSYASSAYNTAGSIGTSIYNTAGSWGTSTYNSLSSFGNSLISTVSSYTTSAYNSLSSAGTSTYNSLSSFGNSLISTTSSYTTSAYNSLSSIGTSTYNSLSSFGNSLISTVSSYTTSAYNSLSSIGTSTYNSPSSFGNSLISTASSYTTSAYNSLSSIGTSTYSSLSSFGNSLSSYGMTTLPIAQNFFGGLYDAGKSTVTGLVNAVTNPVQTIGQIQNAVIHPINTGTAIWNGISTSFNENVINGDANSRARFAGVALGEVALAVVGTKGMGKTVDVLKGTDAANVVYKANTAVTGNKLAFSICFTGETLVMTANGDKQLKDIQVGDKVYAENVKTNEKKYKNVKQTFINDTYTLLHIIVQDTVINTTLTHPFYVVDKGWVKAKDLGVGDILTLANGEETKVEALEIEEFKNPVKVYNFEVEDWHTYFVSSLGVLVHNLCSQGAGEAAKTVPAQLVREGNTATIGKMADLNKAGSINSGEFKVADYLPNMGNPKANWKQNSGILRSVMNEGKPIKDVSPYPMNNAGFLGAERNLLQSRGWTYSNGYWNLPK